VPSTALRNPGRSLVISLAILAAGIAAVTWGALEMERNGGAETDASAYSIGIGLVVVMLGFVCTVNFWRGVHAFRALRSSAGTIAHWHLPAAELAAFRAVEAARIAATGEANYFRLPEPLPAAGIEVRFGPDSVLVGDTYFGLSRLGMFTAEGARLDRTEPPALEFVLSSTYVWQGASVHVVRDEGLLRVPVARSALGDAERVLDHFRRVERGEVRPHARRVRRIIAAALVAAAVCAVLGYLGWNGWPPGDTDLQLTLAVLGAVGGPGCLFIAAVSWLAARIQGGGL
jgi:uncharacterized membrane protein YidH (DUF202 family)